ncbi:MAG: hypothetical protein ABL995_13755 [Bryobacteraceae bacterium]
MADNNKAILARKSPLTRTAALAGPGGLGVRSQLEVFVVFTDVTRTLLALKRAADWARDLHGRIRLIVPQVVPYPLDLEHPQVLREFNQHQLETIAAQQQVQTSVEMYLCRDVDVLLGQLLPENAAVVIARRRRWWPTHEAALARRLRRQGHEVILVPDHNSKEVHHA